MILFMEIRIQLWECRNALYLDGAISEMYCPVKGLNQTYGKFGVIIGVTE